MDTLITAKELGRILNKSLGQITPQNLEKWRLPVVRLDYRRLFRLSDVEQMIQRHVVTPGGEENSNAAK